jgi:probable rRNA maturation factor
VNVFVSDEQDEPLDAAGLRRFAQLVLEAEELPAMTEMAIIYVTAVQIAEYNRRFMGREGPTDVLAFPLEDLRPGAVPVPMANEPPLVLGDVFVCPEEIRRRAAELGIGYEDFLYLLTVHGILHLLGYDHENEDAAEVMERREEELLALAGRRLT